MTALHNNDFDVSKQAGNDNDRLLSEVTGPAPLNASDPDRENTRSIDFFRNIDPDDEAQEPFNRAFAKAIDALSLSKRGTRLLKSLEDNDVHLGSLAPGKAFGYYLAYDRALFAQTSNLARTLHVMAHEARHAEQTVAGWSTIIEYHKDGTRLPHDARSYLRLNRVLEADAEATTLAVMWELQHADARYQPLWTELQSDPHFGPMAIRFEEAALSSGFEPNDEHAVQAGMRSAFKTWFTVGAPLRSDGYDREMLAWLEVKATRAKAPIQSDRAFTSDQAGAITGLHEGAPYWSADTDHETTRLLDLFSSDVDDRIKALDSQLLLPVQANIGDVLIDARSLAKWRGGRKADATSSTIPAAPAATLPSRPGPAP